MYPLLDTIHSPKDLQALSDEQAIQLAGEIRKFLIGNVSQTGGHLSANLGVVELTLALHREFSSPEDRIVFDVGHQAYVHKMVTGRMFAQYNGNAEINMGRGAIVIGLAAIIIGSVLFDRLFKNFALKLLAVSFGAIIYYVVIQAVLTLLKVDSQYLKLMSAAIVAVFLTVPNLKTGRPKKNKKEVSACSK